MTHPTMATATTSRVELRNGSGNASGWNDTSIPTTANPCEFQNALEDALLNVRSLLKAARQSQVVMTNGHHANVLSKVEEISAIAGEIKACLLHASKQSDRNGNSSPVERKKFDPLQPSAHDSESWAASSTTKTAAPANSSQPSIWSGFYNKTLRERFDVLSLMYPRIGRVKQNDSAHEAPIESVDPVAKLGELPLRTANLMIENCIGVIGIPLG